MNRRRFALAALLAVLSGCAGLGPLQQPPEVSLADVEVAGIGLLEQQLRLRIRVLNPNDVGFAIDGMAFDLQLNGKPFARGVSDRRIEVPRYGQAIIEADAVSGLAGLLRQIADYRKGERKVTSYRLSGHFSSAGAVRLPFDHSGEIELPSLE